MITAFVLINADRRRINEAAVECAAISEISEVCSVSGAYDLVAVVRAANNEKPADVVTGHLLKIGGITRSETLVSFRSCFRHDLEAMFGIGLEEEGERGKCA